jgi:hypothetical protein
MDSNSQDSSDENFPAVTRFLVLTPDFDESVALHAMFGFGGCEFRSAAKGAIGGSSLAVTHSTRFQVVTIEWP